MDCLHLFKNNLQCLRNTYFETDDKNIANLSKSLKNVYDLAVI